MPGKASWGQPQIPGTIAVLEKFRLSRQWLGVEVSGAYLIPMNAREGVPGEQPRKLLHHHGIEYVGFSPERDSSVLRTAFPY